MKLDASWLRLLITVALSSLILVFLFTKIDGQLVLLTITQSDIRLIGLAVLVSLFSNIFLGAEKWRRILVALGCDMSYAETLAIRSGCMPLNVVFPMKSYELLKAYYLKRQKDLPFMRALSSIMMDRILNLFVLLIIFLFGLFFVDLPISRSIPLAFLLFIMAFLFLDNVRNGVIELSQRMHPKVHESVKHLISGFEDIPMREKFVLIAYSFAGQIFKLLNIYILFQAAGITVPFISVIVLMPIVIVIAHLPIAILGLGTREASILFLFSKFAPSNTLFSGSILVTAIEYILPVIVGFFFIKSIIKYSARGN